RMGAAHGRARHHRPAGRRRPIRDQRRAVEGGHRKGRRQLAARQGEPDRHADGDARGDRPRTQFRLQLGHLTPLRRNGGHDHRRPGRGHRCRDDQDRRPRAIRTSREVQPPALDRSGPGRGGGVRGSQQTPVKQPSRAVHAGRDLKARSPLAPALSPAAVHVYTDLDDYDAVAKGERPGYYYGRNSNSNREMLEKAVAELEGADAGLATASGMAALHAAMLALAPRPVTIVATRELYGGTLALLR